MEGSMITPEMDEVLRDFSTSDTLKRAIRELAMLDVVDAAHAARLLAQLFQQSADRVLGIEDASADSL
jgi:hypothetical protein